MQTRGLATTRCRERAASTRGDAEIDTQGVVWPQGLAPMEGYSSDGPAGEPSTSPALTLEYAGQGERSGRRRCTQQVGVA